jgi:small subunit ribosomal protein S6
VQARAHSGSPPAGRGERLSRYRPAAVAHLYDLMVLIDASAPDERRQAIVGEIEGMLGSGGTIVSTHDWGSRRLAFEIDHRPEAAYHLWQFECEPELLDRLGRSLRIMDGVLRHRIIRQLPGSPPVPPSPEPPKARREEEPDGRVAARAAADAPPEQEEAGEAGAPGEVAADAPVAEPVSDA